MPTRTAAWTARSMPHAIASHAAPGPPAAEVPLGGGRPASRRWVGAAARLLLRLATGLAVAAFALLAALPLLGHQVLVVTSGSMEPLLSAGDAAVIQPIPAGQLAAGDVITYRGYGTDRLTTHRIVQPVELEAGLHFQTKGDANAAPDPDLAPADGVVGRYVVGLPQVGHPLLVLMQPHGRLLVVGLPALLTLAGEGRYLLAAARQRPRVARSRPAATLGSATLAAVVVAATAATVWLTSAAMLTDADVADGNTFSTADAFPASTS